MAATAVHENQYHAAPALLSPDANGTTRVREQVIGSISNAWRRVAAGGKPANTRSMPIPVSSSDASPMGSATSSWPFSSSPPGPASRLGRRWQPRWNLGRSHRPPTASASSPNGDGRATSTSSNVNIQTGAGLDSVHGGIRHPASLIWGAVSGSLAKPRTNSSGVGAGVDAWPERSWPVAPMVSTEAAQQMALSLQQYHYNSLKYSVLHRLSSGNSGPIACLVPHDVTPRDLLLPHTANSTSAFVAVDLSRLVWQFCAWRFSMPQLEPRFSASVNRDAMVLRTMATLGVPITCLSRADVEAAAALMEEGYRPTVIDAKPCKTPSHLLATLAAGIRTLTVDGADEVERIVERAKANGVDVGELSLIVRLRAPLLKGFAFGATVDALSSIASSASTHGLTITGVSVDMRQFSYEPSPEGQVTSALMLCQRALAALAAATGRSPTHVSLLGLDKMFMGASLQGAVAVCFGEGSGVCVSVEAASNLLDGAAALACRVIGKRTAVLTDSDTAGGFHYYLDDGCYGSLGDVFITKKSLLPHGLATSGAAHAPTVLHPTTLWGPTCDGLDCILKLTTLPELEIGDWVYFRNCGAMAFGARTNFNGLKGPKAVYCFSGVAKGAAAGDVAAVA